MNDQLDLLQQLATARPAYLDAPADPHVRQAHLSRALSEPGLGLGDGRTRRPMHLRPGARLVFGLTAAASVAALAVVTTGVHGSTSPPVTGSTRSGRLAGGQGQPDSASKILLLAADQVLTAPASGKYWRTATELVSLDLAGPGKDPYRMRYTGPEEDWAARSDSATSWGVGHGFSYAPATAADRAAWKRDGSPKTLSVHEVDPNGKETRLNGVAVNDKHLTVDPVNPASEVFNIGGKDISMHAVRRLPSDPAELTTVLMRNYQGSGITPKGKVSVSKDQWLFSTATDVLTLPVAPEVRASAYRILAGLKSVQNLGSVSDLKGRTGNAVAIDAAYSEGLSQIRLVIDPKTGLLLAQETRIIKPVAAMSWLKPSDVWQATVIDSAGWTNDKPPARTKYVPSGKGVG
jgi:hypothetical protein